jgi:hypothetical protein
MKVILLGAAAGLVFGMASSLPGHAQYMAPYPPLIEVPPPEPYAAPQKPASKPPAPEPARAAGPPQDRSPPELSHCYQGRAKIC